MNPVMLSPTAFPLLSAVLLLNLHQAFSATNSTVSRGGECIPFKKQVFGFNSAFMRTNIAYNNPVVEHYLASRNIQILRFPGGTVSSTFSMLTGGPQCPRDARCNGSGCVDYTCSIKKGGVDKKGCYKPVICRKEYPTKTNVLHAKFAYCKTRENVLKFRGPQGLKLDEISKLIKSSVWKAKSFLVPINVCGMSPAQTTQVAEKIVKLYEDAGISNAPRYVKFELGNELYLTSYAYCVDDGKQYVALAKRHLAAIKKVKKAFKVAALMAPSCYKKQLFKRYRNWNAEVLSVPDALKDFDAVTIHLYSRTNKAQTDEETFRRHVSALDRHYTAAMDDLTTKVGKPIWITEWHMSTISDDEDPTTRAILVTPDTVRSGFLGGLYRVLGLAYMFTTPGVEMSNFQSLDRTIRNIKNTREINPTCRLASTFIGGDFAGTENAETEFLRRSTIVRTQDFPQLVYSTVFSKDCRLAMPLSFSNVTAKPAQTCSVSGDFVPGPYEELSGVIFRKCGSDTNKGVAVIVSKTAKEFNVDMANFMCPEADTPRLCKKLQKVTLYSGVANKTYDYAAETIMPTSTKFMIKGYSVAVVDFTGKSVC